MGPKWYIYRAHRQNCAGTTVSQVAELPAYVHHVYIELPPGFYFTGNENRFQSSSWPVSREYPVVKVERPNDPAYAGKLWGN